MKENSTLDLSRGLMCESNLDAYLSRNQSVFCDEDVIIFLNQLYQRTDLSKAALARQAGIACERAIVVNERMETSAEGVYACGDCAQFQGFNAALWSQGQEQGRVAGTNAAGGCAVYTGCDTSLVLNLDGVALFALGDLGQSGGADYEIEESSWGQRKTFQVDPRRPAVPGRGLRVWKGEKLVGVSLMGDLTKMQAWKTQLLKERDGGK